MIGKVYRNIDSLVERYRIQSEMKRLDAKMDSFIKANQIETLSKEEYEKISSFWGKYIPYRISPNYYSIIKKARVNGLQPSRLLINGGGYFPMYQYVSESIIYPNIIRKLNPIESAVCLSDKTLYASLFYDVKRPHEYFRVRNGIYLNGANKRVNIEEAINSVLEDSLPIVIKKAVDTYGGKSVLLLKSYDKSLLTKEFADYSDNYVVQRVLSQSKQISRFNESSLNTFRILTLSLNGEISVLAHFLRCGSKGSFVDNASSGGMFVGLASNGQLTFGTNYSKLCIDKSPSGILWKESRISGLDKILNLAIQMHSRIPQCAFVGWDFALDYEEEPVFIEANLKCPGVWLQQILSGPIFGERFEEVIDYAFHK